MFYVKVKINCSMVKEFFDVILESYRCSVLKNLCIFREYDIYFFIEVIFGF